MSGVKLCKRGHPRTPENLLADGCCGVCRRERERRRYANDPAYRELMIERTSKRYANNPAYRERHRERQRERYANDPAYRERDRERKRQWERERFANDPAYRKRRRDQFTRHRYKVADAKDRAAIKLLVEENPWLGEVTDLKEYIDGP